MSTTYRAAYWLAADRQSDVRLTTEMQSGMSDEDLVKAALACAADIGLEREDGDQILIGDYADK